MPSPPRAVWYEGKIIIPPDAAEMLVSRLIYVNANSIIQVHEHYHVGTVGVIGRSLLENVDCSLKRSYKQERFPEEFEIH